MAIHSSIPAWQSTPVCPPHGQRSLAGYSPRGCKESDTIKQLSTARGEAMLSGLLFLLLSVSYAG